jgi:phosphatidylglycerophosphatase A
MDNFPNLKKPSHLIATLFGVGKLPFGPGTWGSLVTLGVWLACSSSMQSSVFFLLLVITVSIIVCYFATKNLVEKDQKSIVIDEFAGMWLALFISSKMNASVDITSFSLDSFIVAFILFRFFDILKPFPISYIDKNIKNGFGIVLDDLIAGIAAGFLTIALYNIF